MPANKMDIANNQDVLKALGLDQIPGLRSVELRLTGDNPVPIATLTVYLPKKQTDYLAILNSGISHGKALAIIKQAEA
jgi:hypothetical protein